MNSIPILFDYELAYAKLAHRIANNVTDRPARIVEIGCWAGHSSNYLARQFEELKCPCHIYCVDPWRDEYIPRNWPFTGKEIWRAFLERNKPFIGRRIFPIELRSQDAISMFRDCSLDMVFLDGDHTYQTVAREIVEWLPKINGGGFLAGHDYDWGEVHLAVNNELDASIETIGRCWCVEV